MSLCISPTLIAKSLEGTSSKPQKTLGTTKENTEYDISEINDAITSLGSVAIQIY